MAKNMKEKEKNLLSSIDVVIFDMDGTLYQHDGVNNTFKNSSLNKAVIANSIQYVVDREKCSFDIASELVQEAYATDTIGISNFMAKRYGITRGEFFDVVWNMEPESIIRNFAVQIKTIKKIAESEKRLFLLTGAPRVWMENVLRSLVLEDVFERRYHGEMFNTKVDIFESLAKEFIPKTILSVGDQFETDLKPASALGMSVFQIKNPNDFKKLL